jgi:hypothetical protein
MNANSVPIKMREETDAIENEKARARLARFDKNWDWLEANASEVYRHRGKNICVAGQQLFVGDSAEQVIAQARAAHPEDDAPFFQYVPKERLPRIYAF